MFELRHDDAVVASSEAPFGFDAGRLLWRNGPGAEVYDLDRVLTQAWAGAEPYAGEAFDAASAPVTAPVTDIPALDFMLLFSIDEHAAIRTSQDPKVQVFYNMVTDARRQVIALGHPMVTIGVDYLAQIGLIAPGRATQVLAGQAPEE